MGNHFMRSLNPFNSYQTNNQNQPNNLIVESSESTLSMDKTPRDEKLKDETPREEPLRDETMREEPLRDEADGNKIMNSLETCPRIYLSLHLQVRNDDYEPLNRIFYISLHNTMQKAIDQCKRCDSTDIPELSSGSVVWKDEWVRRQNGDKYQIFELEKMRIYDLYHYDINDDIYKNYGHCDQITKKTNSNVMYMLLQTKVRPGYLSKDKINFEISFYQTFNATFQTGLEYLDNELKNDFKNMFPVWQKERYSSYEEYSDWNGDHFQIIKVEFDQRICLNDYCPQIQLDTWPRDYSGTWIK